MHVRNEFVPNSFGYNSVTASGMISRKNLNKITVFDLQNATNGGSRGTKAEPHTPDTSHKLVHSQTKHMHFPKSLRKTCFSCRYVSDLKVKLLQLQKGAADHIQIHLNILLKRGVSGERMT